MKLHRYIPFAEDCTLDVCLLMLTAVLLPFDKIYGSIAIILTLTAALYGMVKKGNSGIVRDIRFWAMAIQVLIIALGIIYSVHRQEAVDFTIRELSLVAFPLIFAGLRINHGQMRKVLWGFIIAYSIRALWLAGRLAVLWSGNGFKKNWYFQQIGDLGGFHPTFMGLYSVIVLILLYYLYERRYRKLTTVLALFHFIFLFVLASRMALLGLVLSVMILTLSEYRKKHYRGRIRIFWGVFAIVLFLLFSTNRDLQFKFAQLRNTDWHYNKYDAGSVATRVAKWQSALRIAGRHPVWGVGTGDLPEALMVEFKKIECLQCRVAKYNNPHNQFLDALARNGVIGLAALLFFILFGFVRAFSGGNIYFRMFMFLITLMLLTECLLNREKGVEVIAFFYAAFIFDRIGNRRG